MGLELDEQSLWQSSDPDDLLMVLTYRRWSRRKLRLFGCAAARLLFPVLPEASQQAIEVAERFADGQANGRQLAAARRSAVQSALNGEPWSFLRQLWHGEACRHPTWNFRLGLAAWATLAKQEPMSRGQWCEGASGPEEIQFLRDIFGDPFHPVSISQHWLTNTVIILAKAIYNERTFDRMPILADALEDAGCDNADILNHCRQPGAHVLGCWALDLLLNKQ
jgi:hypothetical protein